MDVCLRVLKESNKRIFDSYSARNGVLIVSHITFRDCRVHIFSDNLSRNSCIWTKCKRQKSWLTWAICTNFSSLYAILKEISAIENFEIAGWQKVNEPYILLRGVKINWMNAKTSSWLFEFLETGFSLVLTNITD